MLVRLTDEDGKPGWGQAVPVETWTYETPESVEGTLRHYLAEAVHGANRGHRVPGVDPARLAQLSGGMRMDIQRLWMDKRKTALHITHSIPEAALPADRVVVMGPRPGRIVEIIDIDLPRPRRLDKLPPLFNEYAGRIRDIFKAKDVLAMD